MRLYVYCVSDELEAAAVEGVEGVGGAAARLVRIGRLSAVVSAFEGERAAVTREALRAHNRVNAHVLALVTPLPFRFGTLAGEAQLNAYVGANERALSEALARVRGSVEMSAKVRLAAGAGDAAEGPDLKREASPAGVEESGAAESGAGGRGTAFLLAKRREIMGGEALKARAEEAASRLASAVVGLARESEVRLSPEGPIVVRASHLVARADVAEYRERLRRAGARPGPVLLLTSGPWPPYSFSNFSPA